MDFFKQCIGIQSGAEDAADFIQKMQFLASAGGLLDQIAIFDGHADLMAERHEQMKFRGRKAAAVRRAEKKNAKSLFFCLRVHGRSLRRTLLQTELAETRPA